MSQRKNGREWIPEGPASAAAGDAIAVLGRLSTDTLIPQGGAGPVERRQANEAMRAAWRREPKRHRPGGQAQRAESVAERATRVLEVLDRHGGDTKAAGVELGMRGNVVARIAQSARARAAAAS